ncbi:MAG: hypothetical protein R3C14_02015 [Caldilineaceae bacterium]
MKLSVAKQERELRQPWAIPLLLFVHSYRPLVFVVGQLLYAIAPMAELLGFSLVAQSAELLSGHAVEDKTQQDPRNVDTYNR